MHLGRLGRIKRKESALRNALKEKEQQLMEMRRFIERFGGKEELTDKGDEDAASTDASVVEVHEDDRKASEQAESSGEDFIGNVL